MENLYWYHSNGNLKKVGQYKHGDIVGKWKLFSEQGTLQKTLAHRDGRWIEADN